MIPALVAVAVLAAVHLLAHRLKFLDTVPRSRWLSFAGGASVAYVFLHLLPELSEHQGALEETVATTGEETVYAVALLGLVLFYGLERYIRLRPGDADGSRLHLASFAIYNVLIGYLTVRREDAGWLEFTFFAVAMGLHFLTTDYGLRQDHQHRYEALGRWLLAGGVIAGALLGLVLHVPEWLVAGLFALLAGSVVLNVLKEELPEERHSRFLPFVGGAGGYAALLLVA